MTFLFVLVGVGIIAAVAVIVTGRYAPNWGVSHSGDYRPDVDTGPQFDVVVRGYRMDEVDATIAELTAKLEQKGGPDGRT